MMRRPQARARRVAGPRAYVPPPVALGANNAWAAWLTTQSAGTTTGWSPLRGTVSLVTSASAQPTAAGVPSMRGRMGVTWNASGCYVGTITAPGNSQTLAFVGRAGTADSGFLSLTNNGTVNSGSTIFWEAAGTAYARRITTDATKALAQNTPIVMIATLTTAGASLYLNSFTPVTSAVGTGGFSQARCILGAISAAPAAMFYSMNTSTACEAAVWGRVLSAAEIAFALRSWGAHYGVPIAA